MDLSRIPEPLRSRIAGQLEQLPPEVRANLEKQLAKVPTGQLDVVLKKLGPTLERLAGKHGDHGSAGQPSNSRANRAPAATVAGANQATSHKYDPHDHYNNTIRRGDAAGPPLVLILFLAACALIFLRTLGFFA